MRLDRDQLLELAELVAEAIDARQSAAPSAGLVDAKALADSLGVSRAFVYEHQAQLGGIEVGGGSRPRLRFDLERARRGLTTCGGGRASEPVAVSADAASPPRRRRSFGTAPKLVPESGLLKGHS